MKKLLVTFILIGAMTIANAKSSSMFTEIFKKYKNKEVIVLMKNMSAGKFAVKPGGKLIKLTDEYLVLNDGDNYYYILLDSIQGIWYDG